MDSNGEGWSFLLRELGMDSPVLPALVTLFVVLVLSRRTIKSQILKRSSKPIVHPEELRWLNEIIARERKDTTTEPPTNSKKAD